MLKTGFSVWKHRLLLRGSSFGLAVLLCVTALFGSGDEVRAVQGVTPESAVGKVLGAVTYSPVRLTSVGNLALFVEIQADTFANGKWTYKVKWNRTLDRQGSLYVDSKDKTLTALSLSPAARSGEQTLRLNPGTRYRLEFYTQSAKGGKLMLRKFFNTLDAQGNPVSLAQASLGSTAPGAAAGGTGQGTQGGQGTASTTVAAAGDRVFMNVPDNTHGYNGPRGAPDPVVVLTNDYTTRDSSDPGLTQAQRNELRHGGTVPRNPRIIQVFTSVGRPFLSGVHFNIPFSEVCENNPRLKIEEVRRDSIPGLRFQRGPDPRYTSFSTGACTYATLQGSATSQGTYLFEYKTTSSIGGSAVEATTRIYYIVLGTNVYDVTLSDLRQPNGQPATQAVLGGRARVNWNQSATEGSAQFTNYSEDLELWVAPTSDGTNPDKAQNKRRIATVALSSSVCNNSGRGGGDPFQVGCGSYNWIVGNTTAGNLEPGTYNLFVVPWLPYVDRQDSLGGGGVLNGIFNSGGLVPFPDTGDLVYNSSGWGWGYGVGRITIAPTPAGQTSLLSSGQGQSGFGSFGDITGGPGSPGAFRYVRKNAQGQVIRRGSVGVGTGSNTDSSGCNGNWTGGVSCGITINANPGETLELSWSSKDNQGRIIGGDWQSEVFISGPYDQGNATVLAELRSCTEPVVPGGLGPNPSEGFMSSPEGSKSFTVPSCMAGKSFYFTYMVWGGTYGGGTTLGGVMGSGLIVVNVSLNQQIGEITQSTCRLPQQITGGDCQLNSDGTSYNLRWDRIEGILPQLLKVYAGPNQQEVRDGCPSPSTCEAAVTRGGFAQDPANFSAPVRVGNLQPNTTYYNRVVATCDGGGTAAQQRELEFTCRTGPAASGGRVASVARTDTTDTATAGCVLPPIIQGNNCSCTGSAAECVSGSTYTAVWAWPDGAVPAPAPNKTFDRLVFRAAKGSRWVMNSSGQLVAENPALDEAARNAVNSGCPAGTSCVLKNDNVLANPQSLTSQETYQVVSGTEARTTYWNRVAFVCNYGQPNQRYVDVTWPCYTEPGDGVNINP